MSACERRETMEEQVHWVTREQAAEEMGISLSKLYRMKERGEVKFERRDGGVRIKMRGPKPPQRPGPAGRRPDGAGRKQADRISSGALRIGTGDDGCRD